jgi:putative ABC transport system permease protein
MLFLTDLRQALRSLTRSAGFFALAVATLALGIGANTALFSVANSVLWRPLPLPESQRLVLLTEQNARQPGRTREVTPANFMEWRRRAKSFERLAAFQWLRRRTISGPGFAERVRVSAISDGYLETLRVRPAIGRIFAEDERAIVISDRLWRRVLNAEPGVLGRVVKLDGESYTVTGILPRDFHLEVMDDADVFVPLPLSGQDGESLDVIGRLGAGITEREAAAEMRSISAGLARENPKANGNWSVTVENLRVAYTKSSVLKLRLFLGFGGFVLLIACANVAALLLVRFVARQKEFALRMALGANRSALLRHALAESVWIAFPGGAGGAILAAWGVAAIQKLLPPDTVARGANISMDLTALAAVLAFSLLITFLFGLVPTAMGAKGEVETALRGGGHSVSASPRARRRIAVLMAVEVTLAVVLLFGAGLFVTSYYRLQRVELGFDPRGVLAMRISPDARQKANPETLRAFYREVIGKITAVPGVDEASVANGMPLDYPAGVALSTPARPHPPSGEEHSSLARIVSPGFFHVLGTTLIQGRWFTDQDSETAPRVGIVNENLAREMFGAENPVGKDLLILNGDPAIPAGAVRVIGLARNVKELGLDEIPFADIYLPFAQNPTTSIYILAKADASAAPLIRKEVRNFDPDEAIFDLKTLDEYIYETLRGARFNLALVSLFAGLAVLLASVGIYGAISFSVAQRTREFGLRMALGARPRSILWETLSYTARLALAGSAAGAAIAFALGEMMKSALYLAPHQHSGLIYGVGVHDPASFGAAIGLVLVLAAIAGVAPASRAARVSPLTALRQD